MSDGNIVFPGYVLRIGGFCYQLEHLRVNVSAAGYGYLFYGHRVKLLCARGRRVANVHSDGKIRLCVPYAGPCSAAAAFLLNGSAENHLAIELHLLEYVHSLQHYGDACAVVKRFAGNYAILKLHRRKQGKRYIVADAHKALHLVCIKAGIANKLVYGI